jgi:hypothetical protein
MKRAIRELLSYRQTPRFFERHELPALAATRQILHGKGRANDPDAGECSRSRCRAFTDCHD